MNPLRFSTYRYLRNINLVNSLPCSAGIASEGKYLSNIIESTLNVRKIKGKLKIFVKFALDS